MWLRIFHSCLSCGVVLSVLAVDQPVLQLTECVDDFFETDQTSLLQVDSAVKGQGIYSHDVMVEKDLSHERLLELPFEPAKKVTRWELLGERRVMLLHVPYDQVTVNLPYNNFEEQVYTFPKRKPREFSIFLATIKTWFADVFVQLIQQPGNDSWRFDWRRSLAFALFGFFYVGIVGWFLYVSVLTSMFPEAVVFANEPFHDKLRDLTGKLDVVGQIFVDNFLFTPFAYYPAFYILKGIVQEKGPLTARIGAALSRYRTNIVADNIANWAIWIPADVVIFACPMYMRMPLEHSMSFGWTMLISAFRGSSKLETKPDTKPEMKSDMKPQMKSEA